MAAQISYNSHDYLPMITVPVIASFDTRGHITPLYVRLNSDSLKVDSFWVGFQHRNTIEFHCEVIDGDLRKPIVLTYYREEDIWGIPAHS